MLKILEDLIILARERKKKPVEGSYTNKLLEDKTLAKDKVLEEIGELIDSVEKNTNKIHEAADVLYHLVIYLEKNGVMIVGESVILNKLPVSASNLYAKNLFNFVLNLYDKKNSKININLDDEIISNTLMK